ncbi:MAG TPA: zinc-finger domain-containing protein [Arenicellales bacterium]|nr:zinc-finger domain-containing protein [Arenicellales bacterium]
MILVSEIVEVDEDVEKVACDGGKTFGHPRVYMVLGDDGEAECYYCGRRFVRRSTRVNEKQDDAA